MSYYLLLLISVIYAAASSAALPQQSSNSSSIIPQSSNSAIVFETQITDSKNAANSSLQHTGTRSNYYHDEDSANAARYGINGNNNAASHNVQQGSQYERPTNNPGSSTHLSSISNQGVGGSQNQHQGNSNYGINYNNPIYLSSTPRGVINSKYNSQGSDYQYETRPVNNAGNYNYNIPLSSSSIPVNSGAVNSNYNNNYYNQGVGGTNQQHERPSVNSGNNNNYNPLQVPVSNIHNNNKNNPGSNYGGSISSNYPSQQSSSGSNFQYERPQNFNTGGNNNYNILPQVTSSPGFNYQGTNDKSDDNKYPILVSSSNPQTEELHTPGLESQSRPAHQRPEQPSYAFAKPDEETEQQSECVCVSATHCPLLSTRIVTPEEKPCERSSDVRCCFQDADIPASRCGTRMNITIPDVATKPGQTLFGEHPWSVVLLTQENEYVSGGALLDDMHVLTAAHKVHQYVNNVHDLKIRLGEWDAAANHEPYSYLEFPASEVFVYPEFSAKNLHGDVAVVSFRGNIDLRRYPHINSACLPRQGSLFIGHRCWVAGWGQDSFGKGGAYQRVLKHIDVPVVAADECETRLRDTKLGQYFQLDRRSFVCAGGEPQKDACTGDGGSPLVCEDPQKHQFYVAGLVAWGIGCATHGIPGVYVNVAGYSDWITEQITNFKQLKY